MLCKKEVRPSCLLLIWEVMDFPRRAKRLWYVSYFFHRQHIQRHVQVWDFNALCTHHDDELQELLLWSLGRSTLQGVQEEGFCRLSVSTYAECCKHQKTVKTWAKDYIMAPIKDKWMRSVGWLRVHLSRFHSIITLYSSLDDSYCFPTVWSSCDNALDMRSCEALDSVNKTLWYFALSAVLAMTSHCWL